MGDILYFGQMVCYGAVTVAFVGWLSCLLQYLRSKGEVTGNPRARES